MISNGLAKPTVSNNSLGPCTLEAKHVRLEPLRHKHRDGLLEAAKGLDWALMLVPLRTREDLDKRIDEGLAAEQRGDEFAFTVILKKDGRIVGSTAYLNVVPHHKRLEIGSTWYSLDVQGTVVNPECKFLLLKHAFEDWRAVRVQLGTHVSNMHSQKAILKLGAKFEGRLRSHGIMPDGHPRDSFLYSIVANEWVEVKSRLVRRIEQFP